MPTSIDWLTCLAMAFAAVPTFALLACSLRRMRSRDRLTVIVWWFSSTWSVGGGLWASWALALSAIGASNAATSIHFQPLWLCGLAIAGALCSASLHAIARPNWPNGIRAAAHTSALMAIWAVMFEIACHAIDVPDLSVKPTLGLPTITVALSLVLAGSAGAQWLASGIHARRGHESSPRLWLCALVMGSAHALALLIFMLAIQIPSAGISPLAPTEGVNAGTLMLVCAIALGLVAVGLICSWLDTHAHQHNRLLAASLNEANLRLRDQALSDPLTRMPNRLMFEERMKEALEAVGTEPCALAVLFIDLDGFKPINDSFGHVAGDAVLHEIGRRLKSLARPEDTVARVGGDEFLLMTVRPGHEAVAAAIAQRVLRALNDPLTLPNGVSVNLSGSIGIVMYPEHGPASKLIANADAAMYAAKRAGGSTYAFFEPRMELDARDQLALQHDLRNALEKGELQLFYQPKIEARSGQVTGVESLLRWQHAVRGFVPPDLFIPVAERFGLIGAIGNWVIDEACRQLRDWALQGLKMRVSVNLSVHQLRQEDLVQRVSIAVEHFGVDPQLLTFEITESVAMEDTQETMKAFSQLAGVGVSLSIDDFGTGYSSLAYLRRLPAQQLKIDRSFVQDLGQSPDALAIVDAVIKLAHALGLRVVAEGVETARQRDILLSLQCDELQGFLFARPMSARMLTLWAMGENTPASFSGVGRDDFRPSLFMENDPDPDTDAAVLQ